MVRLLRRGLVMRSLLLVASVSALVALGVAGCADDGDGTTGNPDDLTAGSNSDKWVYNGPLPHLENPSVVMSRYTHTARVTGFLPAGYDASKLPFYAKEQARQVGGRTKIDVVYPVATGSSFNLPRGSYTTERVWPRRTDSSAPWGGFPFISYVNPALSSSVGVAFHGPITSSDGEWELIRGPVSHGCNRMQGEHVVELAHLIGVDMTTKIWSGNTNAGNIDVPVKVLVGESDSWEGQSVDVRLPGAFQREAPERQREDVSHVELAGLPFVGLPRHREHHEQHPRGLLRKAGSQEPLRRSHGTDGGRE